MSERHLLRETKCIYCGDPGAHAGTRRCSNSDACDARALRSGVGELKAELAAEKEAHRLTAKDRDETLLTLGDLLLKTVAKRDHDELRAELAAAENLVTALTTQRAADAVASLCAVEEVTADAHEHLSRCASVACAWAWEFAASQDFTERYGRALVWAQMEGQKARAEKAESRVKELEAERVGMVLVSFAAHDVLTKAEAERDALKAHVERLSRSLASACGVPEEMAREMPEKSAAGVLAHVETTNARYAEQVTALKESNHD